MDPLSQILTRFRIHAQVFFSGNLCELSEFNESKISKGHLHLLRSGSLILIDHKGQKTVVSTPSALFFPQGRRHRIVPDATIGADLVCASIDYGESSQHPIAEYLPEYLVYKLDDYHKLNKTAHWMFEEAFSTNYGKETITNKLCDLFIVQILREILSSSDIRHGLFAGLSHPHLAKALHAIHSSPEKPWKVSDLADLAIMSRAKFASLFHEQVGQTPLDYLTEWRLRLAKDYLLEGQSVEMVANKVGYYSGSALARVFSNRFSLSPTKWLKQQQS